MHSRREFEKHGLQNACPAFFSLAQAGQIFEPRDSTSSETGMILISTLVSIILISNRFHREAGVKNSARREG
jgi:hypothetical protein